MQAPVDLTVLRSGVPDTLPGRSINICERGVGAIVAGELVPGESVGVELQLPSLREPLRTRATVRYQDKLLCGLEFVSLSAEQQASIRDWAKKAMPTADELMAAAPVNTMGKKRNSPRRGTGASAAEKVWNRAEHKIRERWWLVAAMILLSVVGISWWRWNHAWDALESGTRGSVTSTTEKPRAQVPAEVMQKLLLHRVEPIYPAEARKARLEGTIALDIVIGRDGSVESTHALNGPDVLARAATDALRWWKFEPYRINGEPAVVETTVAVEFRR